MQKCFHLNLFFWRIQTPDWELGLQPHLTELLLTKSQNHRLNEVGRALWKSSGPTPCSSRATYSKLPRIKSRELLKVSKEDSPPALCMVHANALSPTQHRCASWCSSLCLWPHVLSLGTTEKSLALYSLHLPFRHLPLGWTVPPLSVFPHRRDASDLSSSSWPFAGLSPIVSFLSCTWKPRAAVVASPMLYREGSPPLSCWQYLMQPRIFLQSSLWQSHPARTCSTPCPPGPPGAFLPSCFPSAPLPACPDAWSCSSPGVGFCTFSCNSVRFLSAPFFSLSPSDSLWHHDSGISATPRVFCHLQTYSYHPIRKEK